MVKYTEEPIAKHREKVEGTRFETDFYVRIDEGPYAGVEFVFGDVVLRAGSGISGNGIDEGARLEFQYNVLYSPPKIKQVERVSFEQTLSEILNHRLMNITEIEGGDPDDFVPTDTPLVYETQFEKFDPNEIVDTP